MRDVNWSTARARTPIRTLVFAMFALLGLVGATVALAAGAPSASTEAATNVTATTATLNGTVFPNQNDTTYVFQYGTTTSYGTATPSQGPVSGNAGKSVSADLTGLTPSTTYHFRISATNSAGTSNGNDLTFTTPASGTPPPGPNPQNTATITSAPAIVTFGRATTISGQITGSGNAGVTVTLEENPYPYTAGFKATPQTTTSTATGTYTFTVAPTLSTHYRVTAKTSPPATSPETAVGVRVKLTFHLGDRTPSKGQRVRFYGAVVPGHDGKLVLIQKRTSTGAWKTISSAKLVTATPVNGIARSTYSKRLRIYRTATYRTRLVPGDGDHLPNNSARRTAVVH